MTGRMKEPRSAGGEAVGAAVEREVARQREAVKKSSPGDGGERRRPADVLLPESKCVALNPTFIVLWTCNAISLRRLIDGHYW